MTMLDKTGLGVQTKLISLTLGVTEYIEGEWSKDLKMDKYVSST